MGALIIGGRGVLLPAPPHIHAANGSTGYTSSLLIDATGEKAGYVGRAFFIGATTKSISKVHFRLGSVSIGGTTDLQVSIQGVNSTDAFPDESAVASGLVGNGNIVANSPTSATMGTPYAVSVGQLIAVVIEYSTFNGGDSIAVSSTTPFGNGCQTEYAVLKSGAGPSWAVAGAGPTVVLEFSDGTFGGFMSGSEWLVAQNTHTYKSTSNPDEYALKFVPTVHMHVIGVWTSLLDIDGDCDIVIYSGTTAVSTVSLDKDNRYSANTRAAFTTLSTPIVLVAGRAYYLSVKPTTATSVVCYSVEYVSNDHMSIESCGGRATYATRVDGGSWTENAARRLMVGFVVDEFYGLGLAGGFQA